MKITGVVRVAKTVYEQAAIKKVPRKLDNTLLQFINHPVCYFYCFLSSFFLFCLELFLLFAAKLLFVCPRRTKACTKP